MQLEVSIPYRVYDRAHSIAVEAGVSFNRFNFNAVAVLLEDPRDGPKPTPVLIASLRKVGSVMDAGK